MDRCLLVQNIIDFGDEDIHKMADKYGYNKYLKTEESPRKREL
tara:strand:- start:184 stop:312 length:129 start_codon:yes stop_codon:yes gene_type:complete